MEEWNMLTTKHRLSRTEQIEDFETLRELKAEGVDVGDLDDDTIPIDIQVGSSIENTVWQTHKSSVARYACYVHLTAVTTNLAISDCKITSEFDQDIFLQTDFSKKLVFEFHGHHFHPSTILNQRLDGLRFNYRGQVIEGWLLASGIRPIPRELPDKRFAWVHLTFSDSLGRALQTKAPLSVLRSTRSPKAIAKPGKGLCAGPPPEPSPAERSLIAYRQILEENKRMKATEAEDRARIYRFVAEQQKACLQQSQALEKANLADSKEGIG